MVSPTMSGCINHPGIEAVARCKQCGKPVCAGCVVKGPTGVFCGESCKERHEKFIGRAQDMQRMSRPTGMLQKLKSAVIKLAIFLVAVIFVGFIMVYFKVPVVGDLVTDAVDFLSRYLPFL